MITLMMEAARTSETLVNFYQTTRCYNPEDSIHTHCRENLKSYLLLLSCKMKTHKHYFFQLTTLTPHAPVMNPCPGQ
jgi:hypothetical protein